MKIHLLLLTFFSMVCCAFAQAPVIEAENVMMCPWTESTVKVTNQQTYDSYQWYYKYWFLSDDYQAIEGATSASFDYDWFTYDQSLFKLVVALNGQTYESNTVQIDSYNWTSLLVQHSYNEEQVYINPDNGNFMMCPGSTITNTVGSPYTIVQWYKNGQAIAGANNVSYTITEPGEYSVVAAPDFCPESTSTLPTFVVEYRTDCTGNPAMPVIIADNTMMCPDTSSLVHLAYDHTYDTYQWYYKYWFLSDDYQAIEGATSASFEYDWLTYDQAIFKLVVTLDGQTYESNTVQIDSYNWTTLLIQHSYDEEQVYIHPDTGHFMMCPGSTITNSAGSPFNVFQWYKDDVAIEGATEGTYVITEPGVYRLVASPEICPDSSNTSPEIIVELREDCTAGTTNPELKNSFTLYPNPANSILNVQLNNNISADNFAIYDVTGKKLTEGTLNGNLTGIDIQSLAAGSYIIKLNGNGATASKLFIKQ